MSSITREYSIPRNYFELLTFHFSSYGVNSPTITLSVSGVQVVFSHYVNIYCRVIMRLDTGYYKPLFNPNINCFHIN